MARRIYDIHDRLVQIHTSITLDERKKILDNGWEYNELIRLGMLAKENNPKMIERIAQLELDVKQLEKRVYNQKNDTSINIHTTTP